MFICAGIQITVLSWIGFTKHAEMMNMWQITTHSYSLHRLNTNVLDLMWLGYNTTGAMCDQCWEQSVSWPCSCMVSVSIPHQHQSDPQSLVWSHTLRRGDNVNKVIRSTVQTHFNGTCSCILAQRGSLGVRPIKEVSETSSNSIKHLAFFTYLPDNKPRGLARAASD